MTPAQAIDLETRLINAGIEHGSINVNGTVIVTAVNPAGTPVTTIAAVAAAVGNITAKAFRVEFS